MKLIYCLFACICSFLLLYCLSQTSASYPPQILSQYKQANFYYTEALNYSYDDNKEAKFNQLALDEFTSLLHHLPQSNLFSDTIQFFSLLKMGELESYFDSSDKALQYYNQALGLRSKMHLPDSAFFKAYLFAGIIYYQQSKTDSAVSYFKKAEALQAKYKNALQESERLYNMFGAIYYESGNYFQAKNYFLKATEVLPKSHPFFEGLFVNYNINLATVLFKLGAYDTAGKIFQTLLPYHIYQNEIYNNIGLIHLYSNTPQKAIEYFKKVDYSNFLQLGLYNDIATAYLNLKNYETAEKYLHLAITKNPLYYRNNFNKDLGRSFKLMGDIKRESKNYVDALSYYQHALNQLYPSYTDTSITSVPVKFSGIFSYIDLFNTLVAKAETWHLLYQQTGKLQNGEAELTTYRSAFALLAYIEKTYDSDQARLFLGKIKYSIHSKPVEIAYELYSKTKNKNYLEQLYYFDQQNKASVLAFNQEFSELAQQTNLPLLKNVHDLKTKITTLSIKANTITDSLQLATIAVSIRNLEIELGKKQDELAKQIPLADNIVQSINSLQNNLLDDETEIVSYTLSPEKLTRTVITKGAFNCYQQNVSGSFHDQLQHYITSLAFPSDSFSKNLSETLYSFLIGDANQNKIKRLVIIPDNELCYLPFETLMDKNGSYLVEKYSVQYQYSTSILKRSRTPFTHHETVAFAPFASGEGKDFERLPNSLSEIENLKGEKFIDTSATKSNFFKHLNDYRTLHLATHAIVNSTQNSFSYIAFSGNDSSNSRLYSSEIYNLPLQNTDLVILSACETGAGNFIKGEGVMSLSRAFSYAGCPNIVTTLWKADDYSTAYLTNKLHRYLDKGFTIDKALQQAKLDYLNDKKINPRLKQPYYWSQLVFVGNLTEKKPFSWSWILISVAIALTLTILVIKKSRKTGTHSS